jgi:trimethylamine--corrinoid protein Co-methyltransferase
MVSGAGMMDFESCQSLEKLVVDAEIIGMARRLLAGIERRDDPIAVPLMRRLGHRADYLGEEHTLRWFQAESFIPSSVIDRGSLDAWRAAGSPSTFERARTRVDELLRAYQPPNLPEGLPAELRRIATTAARRFGMNELPELLQVVAA